jgi:heme/copper-type cytochrome/quinol oxidase subunit 4
VSLFNDMCRKPETGMESLVDQTIHEVERQISASGGAAAAEQKIHMDLTSETGHLPLSVIITRAARFFGYLIVFMGIMAVIGLIPTVGLFVVFFMRYENSERWPLVITYATVLVIAITFVFEHIMHIPWPPTLFGQWFPALKAFVPSLS